MTRKQTLWMIVSLFSFICIATNQPFVFLDDGTLLYSLAMIIGVICTSSPKHAST